MSKMSEERKNELTNKANSNRAKNMELRKENLKKLLEELERDLDNMRTLTNPKFEDFKKIIDIQMKAATASVYLKKLEELDCSACNKYIKNGIAPACPKHSYLFN